MNFREWVLFKVPKYLLEAKKKKKVVKHTKPSDGPNPFFELGYLSVEKLKELRAKFDAYINRGLLGAGEDSIEL